MKFFLKIVYAHLIVLAFLIVPFLIWYYPVQRFYALKDFNKYISAQGTNKSNIKSKRVFKDYKQDGYYIEVIYSDDPELLYSYKWYIGDSHKDTFHIFLIIYKNCDSVEVLGIKPKYPRLK